MSIDRRYSGGYLPLREAMDRLLEGSFITPQFMSGGGFPPADLFTTEDDVVVEMAIPGADPNDINVSVTGDTVTISGEIHHRRHTPQQGQQPYLEEMWQGKFQRAFTLPIQVDAGKAQANFQNGILTLTLPKSEATKPRKIQVQQQQTISGQGQQSGGGQSAGARQSVPVGSSDGGTNQGSPS